MQLFDGVMWGISFGLVTVLASAPAQAFPTMHLEYVTPHTVIGPHDSVDIQVRLTVDQDFLSQGGGALHPSILPSDLPAQFASPDWKATYLYPGLVVQWEGGPATEWTYDWDPLYQMPAINKRINSSTTVVAAGTYTFNVMTTAPRSYAPDGVYDFGNVALQVYVDFKNIVTGNRRYEVVTIGRTPVTLTRTVSSVPEPSAVWLMLLGSLGVLSILRQRA